jgi:hypothetical protein
MPTPWTFSYGGAFSEQWEHLTDVQGAPTGEEQRRRLRPSPRTVWRWQALEQGDARRQLEDALHGNGASEWYAPLISEGSVLSAAWTIGDPEILAVDTTDRRFRVGGMVLIQAPGNPRVYDVREVAALAASTITLTSAPAHSWPSGTRVLPLGLARFVNVPALSRFTGDAAPLDVAFRLIDTAGDVTADLGDDLYRSLPVLETRPDWTADPESEPARSLETVDNATGPIDVIDLPEIPLLRQTSGYTLVGRAEIMAFRALLFGLGGRWGSLWLPSWAADLRVTAAIGSADTTLDVAWSGISERAIATNRRDIRIELADGTIVYRRITAAAALGDDEERLTLDAALGVVATVGEVALVSFLSLVRQDADVNLWRYWSADVVEIELSFRGFRDDDV